MNYLKNFLEFIKEMDAYEVILSVDDYIKKTPFNLKEDGCDLMKILKYCHSGNTVVDDWKKIFDSYSKQDYLNDFLIPYYNVEKPGNENSAFDFYPIKYYLKNEPDPSTEIFDIIKKFKPSNKNKLITDIIYNTMNKDKFYDYFKNDFTLEMIRNTFTVETKIEYLEKFNLEFENLFSQGKLHHDHVDQIFKQPNKDKIFYFIEKLINDKDMAIMSINCAFTALNSICTTENTHYFIGELLKKDEKENILNIDCFLLMTKRMAHCGQMKKLPSLVKHIENHHDFHHLFKEIIFSGATFRIHQKKRVIAIDFSHDDFQKELKKYFHDILETQIIEKEKYCKKMKI